MPEMPERLAPIERLLESGVRLAERDRNDPALKGLLIDALKNARLQVVRILWVAGVADVERDAGVLRAGYALTILFSVAGDLPRRIEIAQCLILLGCPANTLLAKHKLSPFMMAVQRGLLPAAELLLRAGADPHQTNRTEASALMSAAYFGHNEMVEMLIKHDAKIDHQDATGSTALILASESGHAAVVRTLLTARANVQQKRLDGDNALMVAVKRRHSEVVNLLIDSDTNVNERDSRGRTPLVLAVAGGHAGLVLMLVKAGADTFRRPRR